MNRSFNSTVSLPKRNAVLVAVATAVAAFAAPVSAATSYAFAGTIAIPAAASNVAGTFVGYDLSVFDPTTQLYYLTDRSNNGIDVFSAATNSYIERIGSGLFSGATASNNNAGPNGITIANVGGGKLLIAGDGTSSYQAFNLAADGLTVIGTPTRVSTAVAGTPTPPNRVDGVAFAPTTNTVLAANNASNPGFVTLVNNANNTVIRSIRLDGTGGYPNVNGDGVEATIFNTARGTFFVAVPVFNGSGAGGVIELNASNGNLVNTYDFNAMGLVGGCGPTGVAQGNGASMVVACGDNPTAQTIVLNPTGAGTIQSIAQVAGGDQVSFDRVRNVFFVAARYQVGGPVLGVIDGATGSWLQNLGITFNDHSVAVDPVSGKVFVAFGASSAGNPNPYCAAGCIGVFAPVPEPASAWMFGLGLLGCFGYGARKRELRMQQSGD